MQPKTRVYVSNVPRSCEAREIRDLIRSVCSVKYYTKLDSTTVMLDLGFNYTFIKRVIKEFDGYRLGDNRLVVEKQLSRGQNDEDRTMYKIIVDKDVTAKHLIDVQEILKNKTIDTVYLPNENTDLNHTEDMMELVIVLTKELEACGLLALETKCFNTKQLQTFTLSAFEDMIRKPRSTTSLKRKAELEMMTAKLKIQLSDRFPLTTKSSEFTVTPPWRRSSAALFEPYHDGKDKATSPPALQVTDEDDGNDNSSLASYPESGESEQSFITFPA